MNSNRGYPYKEKKKPKTTFQEDNRPHLYVLHWNREDFAFLLGDPNVDFDESIMGTVRTGFRGIGAWLSNLNDYDPLAHHRR